jgi:hypothetical protein
LQAAAVGRLERRERGVARLEMSAWLARSAAGAWRHHRLAIATAWLVCLSGWSGSLLLPLGPAPLSGGSPGAEPATQQALPPASAGPASSAAADARQARHERAEAAALEADLDAAVALRDAHVRHLAAIPRLLDAQPNPLHRQRSIQLDQQNALIAALRLRLADLRARVEDLERSASAGVIEPEPGRPAPPAAASGTPGGKSSPASAPVGSARMPRLVSLCSVLLLAIVAAATLALWRGGRDGIIDHPCQLRPRKTLPVLCTIMLPATPEQDGRDQSSRRRAALASLGLLAVFGSLVIAERLGVLGLLAAGLPAGNTG